MLNPRATLNLTALSVRYQESAINTFQDLDQSIVLADSDYFNLEPRRETNAGEMTGKEEPDQIYDNGTKASGTFTFNKLQPNQAAILLAYGLGSCATSVIGSGFEHTITPIAGDVDLTRSNPSFTVAQRIGQTINKRRLASCFVDSLNLTFNTDAWVKGSGTIKCTGKYEDTVIEESVSALDNVTTLTLAANAVQGATAEERLDSVQVVRCGVDNPTKYVTVTAVSDDTPAVITIEPAGGSGMMTLEYKILYTPVEPAWASFPARIVETPLRVSQACLTLAGLYGSGSYSDGYKVAANLQSFEYSLQNNLSIDFTFCAGGAHAGRCFREGRLQTIKLTRNMRNMLLNRYMEANEYFSLRLLCEGAEYAPGEKYTLDLVFPRLGLLKAPLSTAGKLVAEAGDLQVLEDATYGSVIAKVKNQVGTGYAQ